MVNSVVLDNVNHMDLRVRTGHCAEFGDAVQSCVVFPSEFAYVQREYPIVFGRDAEGEYRAMALLGLDEGENLFLDENDWNARYVPAIQARGPFLIGLQKSDSEEGPNLVVNVDLDNPRISDSEGEPVFLPHGGNSPYLEHVNRMLQLIHQGEQVRKRMFDEFEQAGLIEGMEVEVALDDQTKYTLKGFSTISQERLSGLDGETLERLNRRGFLHLAMLVVTSLGNVSWLIELKNRKRAAGTS
jgi:hypothetical protein